MISPRLLTYWGFFSHHEFVDSIHNRYARKPGYVFYRKEPRFNLDSTMTVIVREERRERFGK